MFQIKPKVLTGKPLFIGTRQTLVNTVRSDIMLDRVINVKINFERFKKGDEYHEDTWEAGSIIIRSDYELVGGAKFVDLSNPNRAKILNSLTGGNSSPHFEKVRIKPDIRMSYRGVGKAGLNFELTIANFYTLLNNADFAAELNTASKGMRIKNIEVLFGYFSQFPNLVGLNNMFDAPDLYNNFKNAAYNKVSYVIGNVLYWYRSSMPPDAEYTFYCAVAQTESPIYTDLARKINTGTDDDTARIFDNMRESYRAYVHAHQYSLRSVLEWYISGHYLRYNTSENAYKVNSETNTLDSESWDRYGVRIFIMSYNIRMTSAIEYRDVFFGIKDNISSMMSLLINRLYPSMYYRFGVDGNIYIYDSKEHLDDPKMKDKTAAVEYQVATEIEQWEARLKTAGERGPRPQGTDMHEAVIPAIYSLQYGVISQISCPFFGVLNPGQRLKFNASYSVAVDQESAIKVAPPEGLTTYKLIYYDIDFSTVSEYNNMNLYCTR